MGWSAISEEDSTDIKDAAFSDVLTQHPIYKPAGPAEPDDKGLSFH